MIISLQFTYGYFNDLPKSLEILKIDMGIIHIDEIILPKNTLTCILKGYFSFGVLRLNEKLKYLHIDDIQGKNFAYMKLLISQKEGVFYDYLEYPFIPYNGSSMKVMVPTNLLGIPQINNELNRLKSIKINPNDLSYEVSLDKVDFTLNEDFLINAYKIES